MIIFKVYASCSWSERTIIKLRSHTTWKKKHFSCFPLTTSSKAKGRPGGIRLIVFKQWRKFYGPTMTVVAGTGCEWAGGVYCLALFVSQCFWLITLPSFPLSSCQTSGVVECPPHSLPPLAHSAFSRWHPLPTHLHCVPIIHTDPKSSACADTHTYTLWKKVAQTCDIPQFADVALLQLFKYYQLYLFTPLTWRTS